MTLSLALSLILLVFVPFLWLLYSKILFEKKICYLSEENRIFRIFCQKDKRSDDLFKEVMNICRNKGFNIPECSIWMVNGLIFPVIFNDFSGMAARIRGKYKIFIFVSSIHGYSDDDLRILIAHEMGHLIDYKTHRVGHQLFNRIKKFSKEEFAHFFSAYLYSKEMLLESAYRHSFDEGSIERLKNIEISETYSRQSVE